jgi:hypothetical protein
VLMGLRRQDRSMNYVETTIPAGMTISEYRRSRPRRPKLRTRVVRHLLPF